ncbi:hypothetical protein YYC_02864 [Plasmodium yoelii 17X]|uniref:YIR protein n=1 Tax=Plasmodium yoelii 17X TaxID=1323249 RepID=V7PIF9_PLAYE|nr:hypothetical protein YYC_02864 [Plasmodium yoelii 17X]
MNDDLCGKFGSLRQYLPDDLDQTSSLDFYDNKNFTNYCPGKNCNNKLDKITIGFLWLLEQYVTIYRNKDYGDNTNPFFLYMISWLSYKLKQTSENDSTTINDFYNKHIIDSGKYKQFVSDAYTYTDLEEILKKKNDLLKINIKDLSEFYDVFKLLCSMYGNNAMNTDGDTLLNDANEFVEKYKKLNKYPNNNEGNSYRQILYALSTNYNNLDKKGKNFPSLPEITADFSALTSEDTSSSSIGNKLFTVLSIFGAIAFFLGISYKYSLFGFRKRAQKQYLREKIKNIKKKLNH